MAWLLGQTLINVGAVIGMLPVIGLPLPLVSSGGSALVTSMLVLGMLMKLREGLARPPHRRCRPAAGILRRSLAVLPGRALGRARQ